KNYYVQLRKTTPNACSQEAGDLAFIPKFKEEVDKLVGTLRTGNIKTFYSLELPIERFDKFSVLGEYITSLSGFDGFWAKIIVNVEGYTPAYIFGRDNDGRTTEKKNPNLPKSFPGTT